VDFRIHQVRIYVSSGVAFTHFENEAIRQSYLFRVPSTNFASATTIQREILRLASVAKTEVRDELAKDRCHVVIAVDMWSIQFTRQSYVAIKGY